MKPKNMKPIIEIDEIISNYCRGNVYTRTIEIETPAVDSEILVAQVTDLHLNKGKTNGVTNLYLARDVIKASKADVLVITGDIINDTRDLEDFEFRKKVREAIEYVADGRLCIIELGNHDSTTLRERKWCEGDVNLLKETLGFLPNVRFLADFDILRLKDDKSLTGKGFPTANIEFAGVNLPCEYYILENESPDSFIKYWQQRFPQQGNIFDENTFNFLMLHSGRNFIELYNQLGEGVKNIDIAVFGHQHGGLVQQRATRYVSNGRGIISPNMIPFDIYQSGIYELGPTIASICGATNTRIEWPWFNNLESYGPQVVFMKLIPSKNKGRPLVREKTIKFR